MPSSPFLQDLLLTPATAVTCAVLVVIWFFLWNHRVSADKVSFSYTNVVEKKEWWRCLTAAHSHLDLAHIGFNVIALWDCRSAELWLGHWRFIVQSLALVVLSKLIMLAVVYFASSCLPAPRSRAWQEGGSVGYSAVIFAWMTILSFYGPPTVSLLGLVEIPSLLAPVASLLITQLIVRRASLVGHASGIVAGLIAALGTLDWLSSPYWGGCFLFWVVAMLAISLKATTGLPLPCLEYAGWGAVGGEERAGGAGTSGRTAAPAVSILYPEGRTLGGGEGGGERNGGAVALV
ncbi:hypothetical protein NSK_005933 [Nannochloropsis salina CCMP1776]|jgi:membrane associated rhomboid family serine protease|uniref:Peptidase S54 rhomboid domain-containing protein n=1 Tax=Nannochloropsis salina CCMP1776 TaxID=1027361 RepID=A0A4D9CU66_9STRA|nr:hypothetical protein NSK_005933 [Nannochloropsis salina CCMP1776]|eukprot:TFJ82740.1 hypothetical protein NSK_005933 [Nannochloropsis salina CCMP1776]